MTPDRLWPLPIEVEQSEPLVIILGQEFFPLRNIKIAVPDERPRLAAREFTMQNDGDPTKGRFLFEKPDSSGNYGIFIPPYLPFRYYTLADLEDDLVEFRDSYPGSPKERIEFSMAFDLPLPIEQEGAFRRTTRIKVENHLTGKTFWAVERRTMVGYDSTRCPKPNYYSLIYHEYFYNEMQSDDRIDVYTWIINAREAKRSGTFEALIEENSEQIIGRKKSEKISDQMVSYWHPFKLTALNDPKIMDQIGVTVITVLDGSIDLSVNRPDQKLHGH